MGKVEKLSNMSLIKVFDFFIIFDKKFVQKKYIFHFVAVLAPAGRASQIAKSGLLCWQELARPFHVLCARISNKIYLKSLRHTRSPCVVSLAVPFYFIRVLISALCIFAAFEQLEKRSLVSVGAAAPTDF